jgi:hypothetical protein
MKKQRKKKDGNKSKKENFEQKVEIDRRGEGRGANMRKKCN